MHDAPERLAHGGIYARTATAILQRFTANLRIRWDLDAYLPSMPVTRTESLRYRTAITRGSLSPRRLLFPDDYSVGRGIIATTSRHFSPRVALKMESTSQDSKASIRRAISVIFSAVAGNEWNQPSDASPLSACLRRPARVRSPVIASTILIRETFPRRRQVAACSLCLYTEQARIHLRAPKLHPNHLPALQISLYLQRSTSACGGSYPAAYGGQQRMSVRYASTAQLY